MSNFFVTLVLKTVIRQLADLLLFSTCATAKALGGTRSQASNSNILNQTVDFMDGH